MLDKKTVLSMAKASHLAYGSRNTDSVGSSKFSVSIIGDSAFIAVCGSNDLLDWVENLMPRRHVSGLGWVHGGFYGAAKRIYKSMVSKYDFSGIKSVYVTGHSHGAPVSCLIGWMLGSKLGVKKILWAGFGCPKFLSVSAANKISDMFYPGSCLAVNHFDDPVGKVGWLFMVHPGAVLLIGFNRMFMDISSHDSALYVKLIESHKNFDLRILEV